MLKKTSFYVICLIIGLCLFAISFILKDSDFSKIAGIFIGVGAGLIGMSIANLYMKRIEKKDPNSTKQNEIDYRDERNTMIRDKAKAKAGDIIQWFIIGIAYILIIIDAPLWTILVTVAVFLLYNILGIYYMSKYQKEM